MSSALTPFAFDDALVRVQADEQGEPWFVAKDVCQVLELGKARDAVARLDEDEKGRPVLVDTLGGKQEMATVSESGLYSLIFRSRKPQARRFRKWVTAEVLPTIRKTGAYAPAPAQPGVVAAQRLKPALRERLLADALQAARLAGATTVAEVEALYTRFCLLVADAPAPPQPDHADWYDHFLAWAQSCLAPCGQGRHTRAEVLHSHFRRWLHARRPEIPTPSMKAWGHEMANRYRRVKSGNICYQVTLLN